MPNKFIKPSKLKMPGLKTIIIVTVIIASVLMVTAITVGALTGAKPQTVVKQFTDSIQNNDADLYYSLYSEETKEYCKNYWYYDDERTFENLTEGLEKSIEFYTEQCGENFKITYKINDIKYLEDEELESYVSNLSDSYGFKKLPTKVALLNFDVVVKGDKGEYTSVYDSFYCCKIGGKWYREYFEYSVN
ncbi:MAG: hypothetical protein ACI4IF_00020 [Acutalibacteraceae bacterium]